MNESQSPSNKHRLVVAGLTAALLLSVVVNVALWQSKESVTGELNTALAVAKRTTFTAPTTITPTSIVTVTITVPTKDPTDQATISGLQAQVASLNAQVQSNNKVAEQLAIQNRQDAARDFDIGCPGGRAGCDKDPNN